MEILKFNISNPIGENIANANESDLRKYLDKAYSYWEVGSGSSALWSDISDELLFFKCSDTEFFVMEILSNLSPVFNEEEISWIKHYIGGQAFHFSSRHKCSKEILLDILLDYARTGQLSDRYKWDNPIPDEELYYKLQKEEEDYLRKKFGLK